MLSALDNRHLLLRFQNEEDFLLVLLKESLYVMGRPFFFSKWHVRFSPTEDSHVVPVWVEMPSLPANFYNALMLLSIAGTAGHPLKVDRNSLCLTHLTAARVCV